MIAAMPEPAAFDQTAAAESVAERLLAGPASWTPRVRTTRLGARVFARVYLGSGQSSYLFPTPDGRWRIASGMPTWWRREIAAIMGSDLDLVKRNGGMVPRKAATP